MVTKFQERVYEHLTKRVPKGKVTTYGAIARALDSSPRAVGGALKRNPYAPKVPCHRVVAGDGSIGGFNGFTSGPDVERKIRILKSEGVKIENGRISKSFMV